MIRSAGALFIESDKEISIPGGSPEKIDRSLAGHRFRQVAPATDECFVSRLALRRLSTQVATDHFLAPIIASADAANVRSVLDEVPAGDLQGNVEGLLSDLRQMVIETNTDESIDLSIEQLRGAVRWDSDDRYPSLAVFANQQRNATSLSGSGQDLPALFERLLGKTDGGVHAAPKIWRRMWDYSHWWANEVCSHTFAALLQICADRNIQFRFRGKLTLVDLNTRVIAQLSRGWRLLLCTEALRESATHVARTLSMPIISLPVPVAPQGPLSGFPPNLIELRDQNATTADSLICLPVNHFAAAALAREMLHRADAIDVLVGVSNLIEAPQTEDQAEYEFTFASETGRQQYQLSLW